MIGKTLSHYQIVEKIGAGGMGEVYRAVDTRLNRTVAIKILPSHFCGDPELKQRFEREARVISNLSHPHICTLHDVGHEDGIDFIVMEYLEGQTLAERLMKGALPPDQMLRYGAEIAEALDRAHHSGIVHRDLKPQNVMLTEDGVKLLDFGLAKTKLADATGSNACAGAAPGRTAFVSRAEPDEPLTEKGTVLGTFRYMAPEQLEGLEADARTDIFALGAVLYEMATGQRAFEGKSQASLIAAIMDQDPPPISTLKPMTPPALDWTVRKCLAKNPQDRWQSAADVASELRWVATEGSGAGVPRIAATRRRDRERLAWGVAAVFALATFSTAAVFLSRLRESPSTPGPMYFEISPPEDAIYVDMPRLSPDGRYLAFNVTDELGVTRIWLRPLAADTARPLRGTEGANRPFWSPDSRVLGFFVEDRFKRIQIPDGTTYDVCEVDSAVDGVWGLKDAILFDGTTGDSIRWIPAAGGAARPVTSIDRSQGERLHGWPQFLPDSRHFLYLAIGNVQEGERWLKIGSLDSEMTKLLGRWESRVEYVSPGYLVFVRGERLVAQRFSTSSLDFLGEPHVIAEHVECSSNAHAHFSVSANGVLAYSRSSENLRKLLWVDRAGRELEVVGEPANYGEPRLSPDGERIAVTIWDAPRSADIWLIDPTRGTTSRFTYDSGRDWLPVWSPDGREIAFASDRDSASVRLYRKSTRGAREAELLPTPEPYHLPLDWSADGRLLALAGWKDESSQNILVIHSDQDGEPVEFLKSPFFETHLRFSPDGTCIAYCSDESGNSEVYVQSYPGAEGKWQVSNRGGVEPNWRRDGKELFYIAPDRTLMSVKVTTSPTFTAGVPEPLFSAPVVPSPWEWSRYAVTADGQRFLLLVPVSPETATPISIVVNWTEILPEQ